MSRGGVGVGRKLSCCEVTYGLVCRYDPETNTWSDVPSLKMAVTSPAVVACDGALYVTGGAILEDGDGIELVQKYDTKTWKWTEVSGMLIPRSGSAACVLNGYIYVVSSGQSPQEVVFCAGFSVFSPLPLVLSPLFSFFSAESSGYSVGCLGVRR